MNLDDCELIFQGPQGWGLYLCANGDYCVSYPDVDIPYCDSFDNCLKKLAGEQKAKFLQDKNLWVMVDRGGNEHYFDLNGDEKPAPEEDGSPEQADDYEPPSPS